MTLLHQSIYMSNNINIYVVESSPWFIPDPSEDLKCYVDRHLFKTHFIRWPWGPAIRTYATIKIVLFDLIDTTWFWWFYRACFRTRVKCFTVVVVSYLNVWIPIRRNQSKDKVAMFCKHLENSFPIYWLTKKFLVAVRLANCSMTFTHK